MSHPSRILVADDEAPMRRLLELALQGMGHSVVQAVDGADALVIVTEWNEFRSPTFEEIHRRLRQPIIFDGRNLYSLDAMRKRDFEYYSIGRPAIIPSRQ